MNAMLHCLTSNFNKSVVPEDESSKRSWIVFKLKTQVASFFEEVLFIYGNPKSKDAEDKKNFSPIFMENYAVKLLEVFLNLISEHFRSYSKLLLSKCLNYISHSLYYAKTWVVIKPHVERLFQNVFFPLLCYSEDDEEAITTDELEYVRRQTDFNLSMFDPTAAVIGILQDSIKLRGRDEELMIIMNHVVHVVLAQYAMSPQNKLHEKDGALLVLGSLSGFLISSMMFKDSLEDMLKIHVYPELESRHPIVRARACWVFGEYYNINFKDENVFLSAFQNLLNRLTDQSLIVRTNAALTIRKFIKVKSVHQKLAPIVPQLFSAFLELMDRLGDNDDIVESVQTLVKTFPQQITGFAPEIVKKLVEQYLKLVSRGEKLFESDDERGLLTAIQSLKTLVTTISAISNNVPALQSIDNLVAQLLMSLREDHVEVFQDMMTVMDIYCYHIERITPVLWASFDYVCDICLSMPLDLIEYFTSPAHIFLTKSPIDIFSSGGDHLRKTLNVVHRALFPPSKVSYSQLDMENASLSAYRIVESITYSFKQLSLSPLPPSGSHDIPIMIESIIQSIMQLILEKLKNTTNDINNEGSLLQITILDIIGCLFYYNPLFAIKILDSTNCTANVLSHWINTINHQLKQFDEDHSEFRSVDAAVTVLAFTSIISVPLQQWPQSIQGLSVQIFKTIIDVIMKTYDHKFRQHGNFQFTDKIQPEDDEELDEFVDDDDAIDLREFLHDIRTGKSTNFQDDQDIDDNFYSTAVVNKLEEIYEAFENEENDIESRHTSLLTAHPDDPVISFAYLMKGENHSFNQILQSCGNGYDEKLKQILIVANQLISKVTKTNH
eukprot:TRINITY_DN3428_c0_g1_i1.p1 TRINITY_DN3428_c0_g1~~TRINITY_DN3428_c0_g1_i1.p1  ORF type:complete len:836 (+),score=170.24 TRINITY_DN3428_c0_g1_i1:196-2703(+)